jgi:hypothetical protein
VAKRPRFSRWRRLPGVFRSGEHRPLDKRNELDRIILYVPASILDLAEKLAEKEGAASIQEYCSQLLMKAVEDARIRHKVADFEARRGPLEGLKEIASDPDYLAEWSARQAGKLGAAAGKEIDDQDPVPVVDDAGLVFIDEPASASPALDAISRSWASETPAKPPPGGHPNDVPQEVRLPGIGQGRLEDDRTDPQSETTAGAGIKLGGLTEPVQVRIERIERSVPTVALKPTVLLMSNESAMEIIGRHVGWAADDWGFLPCLRRGEAVPAAKVTELARALGQLEDELRGAELLDRRAAHALHRLALESQVLLTDAWPGVFDENVVGAIRAIQEAVERILSGEDIRYYPGAAEPASSS